MQRRAVLAGAVFPFVLHIGRLRGGGRQPGDQRHQCAGRPREPSARSRGREDPGLDQDLATMTAPARHLPGSANTQSTEPPSGAAISGVSVARDFISLEPLPVATATYCLPLTMKVIGKPLTALLARTSHSTLPVVSSNARK